MFHKHNASPFRGPVTPGKGSTFTSAKSDSTSPGTIARDTTKDSIVATGLTMGARTNVVKAVTIGHGMITDSAYYAYESNGDVSKQELANSAINAFFPSLGWLTLTVASQTTDTLASKDSSITYSGFQVPVHFMLISSGAGSGTANVKGQTVQTQNAGIFVVAAATVFGTVQRDTLIRMTFAFAPTLGWLVSQDAPAVAAVMGFSMHPTGSHTELIDYVKF